MLTELNLVNYAFKLIYMPNLNAINFTVLKIKLVLLKIYSK